MTIQRKRVAKRLASGLLAGALALGGLAISGGSVSAKTPTSPTTNRLAGDDRYETAVEIARTDIFDGATDLVIASGERPYDALAASALAGANSAPILLVKSDSIPESVADYFSDVEADVTGTVFVVGGASAISEAVFDAIGDALGDATVERVAGANRYLTAYEIADQVGVMDAGDTLIIVNGDNDRWADALSAGALAATNGWPIVTTANGGLNDEAKDFIDAYLSQAGVGTGSFLIIGGPAVLPTSIEDYLLSEDVAPEAIRRIAGADRYQTNLLVNIYQLEVAMGGSIAGAAAAIAANNVALASGTSPWDALAGSAWAGANGGYHIALTPGATLGANAQTLAGALGDSSAPQGLYVLGGKSVVSETARTTFIATTQSFDVGAPTISGCTIGATSVTVTFPKKLSTTEDDDIADFFELNGDAIDLSGAGALVDYHGVSELYGERQVFSVAVGATLEKDDVVDFLGMDEVTDTSSRNFAAGSCTVAGDTVRPTFSFRAVTSSALDMSGFNSALGLADSPAFILTASEPIEASTLASPSALSWDVSGTATYATLSAVALDSAGTQWLMAVTASAAVPYEDDVVTLDELAIEDKNGNFAAGPKSDEVGTDLVAPTVAVALTRCEATATAESVDTYGFTITAKSAFSTSNTGAAFNAWKFKVVQSRGMMSPTVVADSDAKMITITADTSYHTGADVVAAAANAGLTGLLGGWTFAGETTDSLTATSAVGVGIGSDTAGTSDCWVLLAGSEPISIDDPNTTMTATVNGLTVDAPNYYSGAEVDVIDDGIVIEMTGLETLGSVIVEISGLTDAAGTVADDFTVAFSV